MNKNKFVKKEKILFITNSLITGGAEKRLVLLIKHLKKDYDVSVLSFKGGELEQEIRKLGIDLTLLNVGKPNIFDLFKFLKIIINKKFDLVHLPLTSLYSLFIIPFIKLKRKPVVLNCVGLMDFFQGKFYRRVLFKFSTLLADKIIAVSNAIKFFLISKKISKQKIIVVHNGVDLDEFNVISNVSIDKCYKVGMIANLLPPKDYLTFLNATKYILQNNILKSKIKFLIVGDGVLRPVLEKYVKTNNLSKNVLFLGFRKDIPHILNSLDLVVLSSFSEGFPNALLEAMATGKPVIATNVGGIPEMVVNNKTGILVPLNDSIALAKAIIRLLKNEKLRLKMGNNGKRRVNKYFSLKNMINGYSNVYESLLNK